MSAPIQGFLSPFPQLAPNDYFFVHLLFPAIDYPQDLLALRRVCRTWRDVIVSPRYWTKHVARVCARLPSLSYTFARSSAPAWQVYAMLLAQSPYGISGGRGRPLWAGVQEAMIVAAHRYPERIARVEGSETVYYKCGMRVILRLEIVAPHGDDAIKLGTKRARDIKHLQHFMYKTIAWRPLNVPPCDCPHHAHDKRKQRYSYPDTMLGPFRSIVRNKRPAYPQDGNGFVKGPENGSFIYFED